MTKRKICKLWLTVCERMAEVHGAPLPERVLELGQSDTGWYVAVNPTCVAALLMVLATLLWRLK